MDKLSPEILEHIISLIPRQLGEEFLPKLVKTPPRPHTLPTLATVSRRFQSVVERITFRSLKVKVIDEELGEFQNIMGPHRRHNLRQLYVTLILPPRPPEDSFEDGSESENRSYWETDQDRRACREAITPSLRRLWNILGTWDEDTVASEGIFLDLETLQGRYGNEQRKWSFTFSLLDLTPDGEDFPALPIIRRFCFNTGFRVWNPRAVLVLTSTMPNLKRTEWALESGYGWGRYYSIDKKYRDALVQGVRAIRLPDSVESFECSLKCPEYTPPPIQVLPRFIGDGASDPVSCAIRELTKHCTRVVLEGPFYPSLFDPPRSAEAEECWQHTTTLEVKVESCSPDGTWIFHPQEPYTKTNLPPGLLDCTQLPPGYGDTEEERKGAEEFYRNHEGIVLPRAVHEFNSIPLVPDDEKLNAMIAAFARCCARMPSLKVADLRFNFPNDDNWPFQVICAAPFQSFDGWTSTKAVSLGSYRMFLHLNEWRPTDATIAELKNVGLERNGQPSIICFLDWGDFGD